MIKLTKICPRFLFLLFETKLWVNDTFSMTNLMPDC